MQITTIELAKLIKKCALEIKIIQDSRIVEKHYRELGFQPSSNHASRVRNDVNENSICEEIAHGINLEPLGAIAYLLLAYAWNDALAWADEQTQ